MGRFGEAIRMEHCLATSAERERYPPSPRNIESWGSAHLGVMSLLQSDGGRCDSDGPYHASACRSWPGSPNPARRCDPSRWYHHEQHENAGGGGGRIYYHTSGSPPTYMSS